MARRKKPCSEAIATAQRGLPPAYYRLHALLETIRAMQCHEDQLCMLLAEIQRSGKITSGVRRELIKVLDGMPVMRVRSELDACFAALEEAAA